MTLRQASTYACFGDAQHASGYQVTNRERKRTAISRAAERIVLCSTLAAGAATFPQTAYAAGEEDTFYNAGYNYCDATLLAAFWNTDSYAAKLEAGGKIQDNKENIVTDALSYGRNMASCQFSDTGHSYQDAEKLAAYWGMANVVEAKNKVAELYTRGNSTQVRNDLAAA